MSEDEQDASAPDSKTTSQRPQARFSGSGGLSVGVWKSKNDEGREWYSVRLDRSYRNADGEFESTPYLRDGDLLRAQRLLDQADAWIEQDKQKTRAASAPSR